MTNTSALSEHDTYLMLLELERHITVMSSITTMFTDGQYTHRQKRLIAEFQEMEMKRFNAEMRNKLIDYKTDEIPF